MNFFEKEKALATKAIPGLTGTVTKNYIQEGDDLIEYKRFCTKNMSIVCGLLQKAYVGLKQSKDMYDQCVAKEIEDLEGE